MPYRRVEFYKSGYYHVYNRGNRKKEIFHDKGDYVYFLKKLKQYRAENNIRIVAYCLMPNHFHFLLQQKSNTSISAFMMALGRDYAEFYNHKYKAEGRLFQGPFKAQEVLSEQYLIHLTRYIHLNPLDIDEKVSGLGEYPWSSYPEYVGVRSGTLPEMDGVIRDVDDYKNYVLEGSEFRIKDELKKMAIDYDQVKK